MYGPSACGKFFTFPQAFYFTLGKYKILANGFRWGEHLLSSPKEVSST